MFQNHVRWFQENRVAGIVAEIEGNKKYDWLRSYYPVGIYNYDKLDRPIFYERLGLLDIKGVLGKFSAEEALRYFIYLHERLEIAFAEARRRTGKPIDNAFIVEDLTGLGFAALYKPGLDLIHTAQSISQDQYPETAGRVVIINTPKVFTFIWGIIKPWIDENTLSKVEILGYEFKEQMGAAVAKELLPKEWGGSCATPLQKGGSVGFTGNNVTLIAQLTSCGLRRGGESNLDRTLTVSSSHEVVVDVVPDTWISYQFSTAEHDIGFGIVFGPSRETVLPLARYDCHTDPCQGRFQARKAGKYTLMFDNSFSMFRSKQLTYKVFVQAPGDQTMIDAPAI
eukprot:TRINITY_DN1100_c0_g1_i5.p1 TRINITY_DN1100_c0_g1~~TRINITY_DN1100_c0_g1_i5.p1  ORF type:complete len:397 (-),score=84.75 TRINITY_DN1100_c0_g1_i5:54-1070(-)